MLMVVLVGLLVGGSMAILPLPIVVPGTVILLGAPIGVFLAYKWPEVFLISAIWTNFLKFTFIYSIGELGITPFMIFLALALTGYGLRILSGKHRLILPVGFGFLVLFISFSALSLVVAKDLEVALGPFFRTILDWTLMLLIVQMITNRHNLKRLLVALLVQAMIVIAWGVIDTLQAMIAGLPLVSYSSFFWNQFRKNDFAVYLAFVSLLSLVVLLRGRKRLERYLATLLLLLVPVAWFMTRSRSGLLALIIGLFIFFVLERNGKLFRLFLIFSVLGAISFTIFPSEERDLALDGFRAFTDPENVVAQRNIETIHIRLELMEVGLQVFASQPLLGIGFNQWRSYSPISNYRRDPRTGELVLNPLEIHNRHLQIATNSGVFALLSYLAFVVAVLFSAMRARRKARGSMRSLLHALIAILIAKQMVLLVMTGFLWEWPIFGILAGVINVTRMEKWAVR